jgi:hypothetical protein
MPTSAAEAVSKLIDAFAKDHPERTGLGRASLQRDLEQVYVEVVNGTYTAPTPEHMEARSEAAGIEANEYLALVNLAAHAATDRPIAK